MPFTSCWDFHLSANTQTGTINRYRSTFTSISISFLLDIDRRSRIYSVLPRSPGPCTDSGQYECRRSGEGIVSGLVSVESLQRLCQYPASLQSGSGLTVPYFPSTLRVKNRYINRMDMNRRYHSKCKESFQSNNAIKSY